jgi:outer membrane protein assembly factor BamB
MTPMNSNRMTRTRLFRRSSLISLAVVTLTGGSLVGCATPGSSSKTPPVVSSGLVTANNFVTVANSNITDDNAPVLSIHIVGDTVFVYSTGPTGTRVTSFSRALSMRWARVVGSVDDTLRPPVRIGERFIFPTEVAIEIITKQGVVERKQTLPHPITSDVFSTSQGMLLAGTASSTGGRAAMIDPTREILPVVRDVLLGQVTSKPVEFEDTAYAATAEGKVFAIGPNNVAVWPLEDGAFVTDSTINADLVVDDFGLYVAAGDSKLYVIDRVSGKIKWRYYAQSQLIKAPFVTPDRVYQPVGKSTLVALDKIEGDLNRKALWTIEGVDKVIAADASHVYVVSGSTVNAVDKSTGQIKFSTQRTDLAVFAVNTTDSVIYAATKTGELVAFRPVLTGAATGELVLVPVSVRRA